MMSWLDKAKNAVNKGIDDLKDSVSDSVEEAKLERERAKELSKMFKATSKSKHIEIDDVNKLWRMTSSRRNIYNYSDLVSYDLIQDGDTVTSGGFGIGRAITGTLLTGGIGALLGFTKKKKSTNYTNNLQIRITNSATKKPTSFITLIDKKTDQNSKEYRKAIESAQETLGILDIMTSELE